MADPTDNDSKEKTRDGEAENNISKENANTDENAGESTEDEGSEQKESASSGGGNNDIPNNDNSSGQDDNSGRPEIPKFAQSVIQVDIQDEMESSYLDYSMSVIIGRALPDVRDGLKPVHRRILYAMFREGILSNRRYSKCAGVVGEVLKKYHPHGDSAVYDSLVRMAQNWNMRVPLIDGQGNFGSIDGDPAAAYRYTECRMTKIAETMLRNIDKDTVNFGLNFDGSTEEPLVLPAAYPNLLVNGSEGIAVGMATKIPPHNLSEVIDGLVALIENPSITIEELTEFIPGPDFPTAGRIYGRAGIDRAYQTGKGKVKIRGTTHFEEIGNDRWAIIIDEVPFQVNKAKLVEEIANLVRDKKVEEISGLRDESDRKGMRVVVELKRIAIKEVVLNKLFKHTRLQNTFGIHMLAIVNKKPVTLTLKDMLEKYLAHRKDVTIRRCNFDLRKAKARLHILEGLLKALDHLDRIIQIIRQSSGPDVAKEGLMTEFDFSEIQSQAILNMRLQRLTGMERDKLVAEQSALQAEVLKLEEILDSEQVLLRVITEELREIKEKFATPRRSVFVEAVSDLSVLDLIPKEEQVLTLSVKGYIKRTSMDEYQEQKRGGKGKRGMKRRDEDYAKEIFVANTHSDLLIFLQSGVVYKLPVHQVPKTGRDTLGTPILNLIPIEKNDKIASVLSVYSFEEEGDIDLMFCSYKGLVKRTPLRAYQNIRKNGLIAYGKSDKDHLFTVVKSKDGQDALISTSKGMSIRFPVDSIRQTGRSARGVKGISLRDDDSIASIVVVDQDSTRLMLSITQNGFGKRTSLENYRSQHRGGKGVIDIVTSRGNGDVVGALIVEDEDRVIMITNKGQVIRIPVKNIRITNRNTKGVTLMKVEGKEQIVAVARVVEETEETEELVEGEVVEGANSEENPLVSEESQEQQQTNSDQNSLEVESANTENKDQENKDPVVQE